MSVMAWHRQLSGPSIGRQTSRSALLCNDLSTPSQHSSATDSRGSTSERVAPSAERQDTLESEEGFDPCPSSWYRQAKQTGGLGGAWRLAFMCLCLPVCYPCYITRKYRRRRRASTSLGGISPSRRLSPHPSARWTPSTFLPRTPGRYSGWMQCSCRCECMQNCTKYSFKSHFELSPCSLTVDSSC